MKPLGDLYRPGLGLLTDLYQLTMAYGYWRCGLRRRHAAFHLIFREHPFGGGFTVACGLAAAVDYLERFRFEPDDLAYLSGLRGNDGGPLFPAEFLEYLAGLTLHCDVDAMPEGTVVFPHEPLVRVCGPIIEAQLLETPLLNLVNFPTLVATKAARVVLAARGDPVIEFGLRRAQGVDGGVTASRAAYVGGCAGTSNVLAGRLFDIPVKGTHAHSWVMCFDSEPEAFARYAEAMPNNCIFLVDTYDTLEGVRHAVEVGRRLRAEGHEMVGVRLDSGDLAPLSIAARRILDEGGFPKAVIVASSDLDEHVIDDLKRKGAKIGVWGVGTRLATAYDQPALGGVYKLSAVRDGDGPWLPRVKVSEQTVKSTMPGVLGTRRFLRDGKALADVIYDETQPPPASCAVVDPADADRRTPVPDDARAEELLVPVLRGGRRVYDVPPLDESRRRTAEQLALFDEGVTRRVGPLAYLAGLEEGLHERKKRLMLQSRRREE